MKTDKEKQLLLKQLRETPVVEYACKKLGIGRSSFYRWKQQDKEFAKNAEEAILEGEMLITDMSESQLISLIREKNFPAIHLWLKAHHPKYGNKVEISGRLTRADEELTPEQMALVKTALRLASFDKNYEEKK